MPEGVGFVEGTGVLALYFAKGERMNTIKTAQLPLPFSEDQFIRVSTNLRICFRNVCRPGDIVTEEQCKRLYVAAEEACDMMHQLDYNFSSQFHHNPRARRVCPNQNCHSIYAYFYEDFLFCPKCGTKLIGKGPGMEENP